MREHGAQQRCTSSAYVHTHAGEGTGPLNITSEITRKTLAYALHIGHSALLAFWGTVDEAGASNGYVPAPA